MCFQQLKSARAFNSSNGLIALLFKDGQVALLKLLSIEYLFCELKLILIRCEQLIESVLLFEISIHFADVFSFDGLRILVDFEILHPNFVFKYHRCAIKIT